MLRFLFHHVFPNHGSNNQTPPLRLFRLHAFWLQTPPPFSLSIVYSQTPDLPVRAAWQAGQTRNEVCQSQSRSIKLGNHIYTYTHAQAKFVENISRLWLKLYVVFDQVLTSLWIFCSSLFGVPTVFEKNWVFFLSQVFIRINCLFSLQDRLIVFSQTSGNAGQSDEGHWRETTQLWHQSSSGLCTAWHFIFRRPGYITTFSQNRHHHRSRLPCMGRGQSFTWICQRKYWRQSTGNLDRSFSATFGL